MFTKSLLKLPKLTLAFQKKKMCKLTLTFTATALRKRFIGRASFLLNKRSHVGTNCC